MRIFIWSVVISKIGKHSSSLTNFAEKLNRELKNKLQGLKKSCKSDFEEILLPLEERFKNKYTNK